MTGTAHTSGDSPVVSYHNDSFTFKLDTDYFESSQDYNVNFNPVESIGVGTVTGSETSLNYMIGVASKTVSVPTQSI